MKRSRGAIAFLVLDALLVFVPLSLVVVWTFAGQWAWPDLIPQSWSSRGLDEAFGPYSRLGSAVVTSVEIALITSVLCTVAAALAARALVHHDFVGKNLFQFASIIPFLIPTTVFAMGVQVLFLRLGLSGSIFGVALSHSAVALPYALAVMLDVTRAIGTKQEEQSLVLGASKWQTILHVTLPSITPGLLAAAAIAYIESMIQYFLTVVIGSGRVLSITTFMFPFLQSSDRTIAAVYALVFLLTSTIVFLIFEAVLKRTSLDEHRNFFM
ncbi:MAG: ABC transporter permease subunit [Eggerthellaceae bacterium]|nr:ABC transporter permease subunit [Eggerthellaceae bacterium]